MRSRPEAPEYRPRIIDVEVNEPTPPGGDGDGDDDDDDSRDTNPRLRPQTFRDRHALKVLGVVMGAMFATVIIAQVGC